MANQFGYNQQFADKPEMWDVDGYAVVTDGYGTLVVLSNVLTTQGSLVGKQQLAPSSAVHDITETSPSSGIYKIHLNQTWIQLESAAVETVIPTGSAVPNLVIQHLTDTVGNTSYGPGQAELQFVQFKTIVPNTGSIGVLGLNSGLRFRLRLKNSSA